MSKICKIFRWCWWTIGWGGGWASTIAWLDDVQFYMLDDKQIMQYDQANGKRRNVDMPETDKALIDLTDVQVANLQDGQIIKRDEVNQKFVNADLPAVFKVKGSVEDFEHLPTTWNEVGDVYNVLDTGANYVWTGTEWDKLSETVDLESVRVQVSELPADAEDGRIYQYVGEDTADYIKGHFYINNNGTWEEVDTNSGSWELTNDLTSNVAVWGVEAGTTFTAGTSLESIIRQMLVKYFAPTVTLTINPSTSPVISGTTIASVAMSAVATKRSDDITSIRFYANNVLINEVTTEVASGGTFTYTYTPAEPIDDDVTFKVTVSDGTSDVDATKKIDFVSGSYFGQVADTVTTPTAADITALTQVALTTKGYTANNISMTYGKLLYAYPASYGNLTSIKDANNFEYINSYTKSTVAIDGVDYNCYLMADATGVSGFKQIYA